MNAYFCRYFRDISVNSIVNGFTLQHNNNSMVNSSLNASKFILLSCYYSLRVFFFSGVKWGRDHVIQ